jgi:hypothetical protein
MIRPWLSPVLSRVSDSEISSSEAELAGSAQAAVTSATQQLRRDSALVTAQ